VLTNQQINIILNGRDRYSNKELAALIGCVVQTVNKVLSGKYRLRSEPPDEKQLKEILEDVSRLSLPMLLEKYKLSYPNYIKYVRVHLKRRKPNIHDPANPAWLLNKIHRKRNKLTKKDERVQQLWLNGLSVTKIMKMLKRSQLWVRYQLWMFGINNMNNHSRRIKLEEIEKIILLRKQGETLQAIGKQYNVTREAIRLILKRNAISLDQNMVDQIRNKGIKVRIEQRRACKEEYINGFITDESKVAALRNDCRSMKRSEILKKYNISNSNWSVIRNKLGLRVGLIIIDDELLQLYRNGLSYSIMAAQLDVSKIGIAKALSKYFKLHPEEPRRNSRAS
jgi:hypothetical protein